jgi:hypothetical protein
MFREIMASRRVKSQGAGLPFAKAGKSHADAANTRRFAPRSVFLISNSQKNTPVFFSKYQKKSCFFPKSMIVLVEILHRFYQPRILWERHLLLLKSRP